jgi:hypothetical protein
MGLLAVVPAARADIFLADFQGYDWTWPTNNCLNCANNYYEAQGVIGSTNPALIPMAPGFQYTFALGNNLFFSSADTFGTTIVAHYINGSIDFYSDPIAGGTAAAYNVGGQCDAFLDRLTFIDGTNILSGTFSSFDIIWDTTTGDGNFAALTNWVGGTMLPLIPLNQRTGWTFSSIGFRPGVTPCGYHWQLDGEAYLQEAVPVRGSTWGEIKTLGTTIQR